MYTHLDKIKLRQLKPLVWAMETIEFTSKKAFH